MVEEGGREGAVTMEEGGDRATEKRERDSGRVESLGWLTESAIMPKKKRAIEGVGASSIVELRAQLFRTQEDVKRAKDLGIDFDSVRPKKKVDAFLKTNSGVEERATRDKLQLKAVKDGSESYAALEKKAELYDKLARGELPDEEEKEKYSIDFVRKGSLDEEFQDMENERRGESTTHGNEQNFAHVNVSEVGSSEEKQKLGVGWGSGQATGLSFAQKQIIREVNEETVEAREKASTLKQRRQLQAEKNRDKLRLAFLKKQVEKLKQSGGTQKRSLLQEPSAEETPS